MHYFDRLTLIEVTVDLQKTPDDRYSCEFVVQAEHKHDFVAREQGDSLWGALDAATQKIEQQLRRYKERVQQRHRNPEVRRTEAPVDVDAEE